MLKKKIGLIIALSLVMLFITACGQSQKTLTVSTFKTSAKQEQENIWKNFDEKYDLKIKGEFGTEDERLENSKTGIDVIELTQRYAVRGNKQARFKKLDFSKLKNFKLLSKEQQQIARKTNSIPYQISVLGVAYDVKQIEQFYSWNQLWDKRLEKHLAIPDISTVFGPEMLYIAQGHYQRKQVTSVFVDNGLIDANPTFSELKKLRPNILKTYEDPKNLIKMFQSGKIDVAVVSNEIGEKIQKNNENVRYVLPNEETYLSYKMAAILNDGQSKESYRYLDYLIKANKDNLKKNSTFENVRKIDYTFLNKHLTNYTKQWNEIIE
ncbi:ABC transporter substrate-binding protein [Companilactobacillus futsaii]|uniref:Extracellular solute-binding protein n=2 Tax=Companilactobacillus futsaii TaxID=938155 RepID=A0A5B7T224_9LACO|nr:extracellular solute-binding protein [Companilactobacillus futsaii]KRK95329.1 spermidine putrescine-binding periplasmic protein [Companilactobacillus futsaii JCM 17355]QCX25898.1 extracellular solute-binding protein [Companilactobacillus futsaii]